MNYGDKILRRIQPRRVVAKIKWEARKAIAGLVAPRVALHNAAPFELWDERYDYFIDTHNMTWRNERAVELAIARRFVETQSGRGMEFGNVLVRYGGSGGALVVDKYEKAPGVVNVDIIDFSPEQQFDYIISVSTLEHVGWDEPVRDLVKIDLAYQRLVDLLAPGGRMLLTAPTGYHPGLDAAVMDGEWPFSRVASLVRTDRRANHWKQSEQLANPKYVVEDGLGADGVWVLEYTAPE